MNYSARTRCGDTIETPNDRQMDELLDSLNHHTEQHADVCLTHESGWSLSVFDGGLVVWENSETGDGPSHMTDQSRQQILSLWHNLARGETQSVDTQAWQEGAQPDD